MSFYRTYSKYKDVSLCPIKERHIPTDEYFPRPDEGEIKYIMSSHLHTNI